MANNNRFAFGRKTSGVADVDFWADAAKPTGRDLNDLARSIVEWGWSGSDVTPGTITVNANGNNLSGVGTVTTIDLNSTGRIQANQPLFVKNGASPAHQWAVGPFLGIGRFDIMHSTDNFATADNHWSIDSGGMITKSPSPMSSAASTTTFTEQNILGDGGNSIFLYSDWYRMSSGTGHGTLANRIRRQVDGTPMGQIQFDSSYVSIGWGGSRHLGVDSSGNVVFPQGLRSTNPGAGSKACWYDPSDGNRVKYQP
jgi:hypothetical protein